MDDELSPVQVEFPVPDFVPFSGGTLVFPSGAEDFALRAGVDLLRVPDDGSVWGLREGKWERLDVPLRVVR